MCTCGIDIATQQLSPARTSTTCSAARDIPSGCVVHAVARPTADAAAASGKRRRSASDSGAIVITQNAAMPR